MLIFLLLFTTCSALAQGEVNRAAGNHLTAHSASKDRVDHRRGLDTGGWLWLQALQEIFVHGIYKGNEILMCILLPSRPKTADSSNRDPLSMNISA